MKEPQEKILPYDGVIPPNHPETYQDMLSLCCVREYNEGVWFIVGDPSYLVCCDDCDRNDLFPPNDLVYITDNWHDLVLENQVTTNCCQCRRPLLEIRKVYECADCTDVYFDIRGQNAI